MELATKLLLEGLTDGLLRELKLFMVVNSLKTTTEWRELMLRLNKLKITDNTQNKNYKPYPFNCDISKPFYFNLRDPILILMLILDLETTDIHKLIILSNCFCIIMIETY